MASRSEVTMTTRITWLLPLLVLIASPALGQLIGVGTCPKVTPKANTNATRLLGWWYEYKRYPNSMELGAKCVGAVVDLAPDGSTIELYVEMRNWLTGKRTDIQGTAVQYGGVNSSRFTVTVPDINLSGTVVVVETDYKNYAVLWSCTNALGFMHYKYSWILIRNKSPSIFVIGDINAALKRKNLSSLLYVKTLQSCEN